MCPADDAMLARALMRPASYPHAVTRVERLETHISWVFLTGSYAYKIKKPVNFGFLDFTTLEARRRCCEDEVRLNRRLASDLYLDVVPICGSAESPHYGGDGPAIEYAVRMREFPQQALASSVLERGLLTPELVEGLARRVAAFHAALPPAEAASAYGTPAVVMQAASDNFTAARSRLDGARDPDALEALHVLHKWTEREYDSIHEDLLERTAYAVKECHGDLHLSNIVLLDGELVPFDCLEFSASLRWIDVMSEVAFVVMDLLDRGANALAWLFLNTYLEARGDYAGLRVLRFYLVYRAMVRAKVHLLRATQSKYARERERLRNAYRSYVKLATRCATWGRAAIVLMHGYSGSGKTSIARQLVGAAGGITVRSDVERKRLHGLEPLQSSSSAVDGGIYTRAASDAVYAHLCACASHTVRSGYTAIVDAAFLRRSERARFFDAAQSLRVPATIMDVQVPADVLNARVCARQARGDDASEATAQVLQTQIATSDPLGLGEGMPVVHVDGRKPLGLFQAAELLGHISAAGAE